MTYFLDKVYFQIQLDIRLNFATNHNRNISKNHVKWLVLCPNNNWVTVNFDKGKVNRQGF